jgi:hypothetical protein
MMEWQYILPLKTIRNKAKTIKLLQHSRDSIRLEEHMNTALHPLRTEFAVATTDTLHGGSKL